MPTDTLPQRELAEQESQLHEKYEATLRRGSPEHADVRGAIEFGSRHFAGIIDADDSFRDQLARGHPYSPVMDAVLFSMLVSFARHTEDFVRDLTASGATDLAAVSEPLVQALTTATAILEPPPAIATSGEWKQLIHHAVRWLQPIRTARPQSARSVFESARRFWNGVPVISIVRALRRHNLTARGLDEDEIDELGDVTKYPGTLLGELQERYWHARTSGATA